MNFDITNPAFSSLFETVFLVFISVFYFIFALIMVKQTSILSKSIQDRLNPVLKTLSYVHLVFALLLIVLAFRGL